MKKFMVFLLLMFISTVPSSAVGYVYSFFNATDQEAELRIWEWSAWRHYQLFGARLDRSINLIGEGYVQPFKDLDIRGPVGYCLGAVLVRFPKSSDPEERRRWYIAKISKVTTENQQIVIDEVGKIGLSIKKAGDGIAISLALTANPVALIAAGVVKSVSLVLGKALEYLPSVFEKITCKKISFTLMKFENEETGKEFPFLIWW